MLANDICVLRRYRHSFLSLGEQKIPYLGLTLIPEALPQSNKELEGNLMCVSYEGFLEHRGDVLCGLIWEKKVDCCSGGGVLAPDCCFNPRPLKSTS